MARTMNAAIFDVDGTLCDVSEVRFHVNPTDPHFSGTKRFDRFHAESLDCPANPTAIQEYERASEEGLAIIVVTARKLMWRYHTMVWLSEHDITYDELLMRADNDDRKDFLVKEDILHEILAMGYTPIRAVDDNPAVIEVWERHGIDTIRIPGWDA